jgi:Photosynthetic reaction centre cytochrome C subunit
MTRLSVRAATAVAVAAFVGALTTARVASQQRPPLSDQVFKNVQVLKGIPVDEFLGTMGIMAASLQFDCSDCHVNAGTANVDWAADTPRKIMARRMVSMVAAINQNNFGGRQLITCWTCHRNRDKPLVTPTLATIYGTPTIEPDDVVTQFPGADSPESILDRFIQAAMARLKSWRRLRTNGPRSSSSRQRPTEVIKSAPMTALPAGSGRRSTSLASFS